MTEANRHIVYRGKILTLAILNGKWEVVEHAPAVVILAMRDGKMLTVRQRRPAAGVTTLEAPAGLMDEGETPLQAAGRELGEETGLAGDLRLLSRFYSSPGFTDELLHLYRADNLRHGTGERDEDERDLEVLWIEPERLLAGLREGSLESSGPTVAAALFALLDHPQPAPAATE